MTVGGAEDAKGVERGQSLARRANIASSNTLGQLLFSVITFAWKPRVEKQPQE